MKKKKKEKIPESNQGILEFIRRKQELENYGKIISLRPGQTHKSKKLYTRKQKHKKNYED